MESFIANVFYFIVTIGILVFIHEFGHFFAAKTSKMRVDVFALGMGYRLFGWNKINGFSFGNLPKDLDQKGETDYRICAFPLGGYVKIAGMIDESMDTKFMESEPKPWEFRARPTYQKLFVISAGVIMNLLLTYAVYWGSNFFEGKQYLTTTSIGIVEPGSTIYNCGFAKDDKIVSINNKEIKYWQDIEKALKLDFIGKNLNVKVLRSGIQYDLFIPANQIKKDKPLFIPSDIRPLAGDVLKNTPAEKANIKLGDILLELNNTKLYSKEKAIEIISANKNVELPIKVLRGKDTLNLKVTPGKDGRIGIIMMEDYTGKTEKVTFGFFESFGRALSDIAYITEFHYIVIKKVISKELEFKSVFGGPKKIAEYATKSAESGMSTFFQFLAILSLNLAIINFLPFPALDGGHFIIILIEGIIRRELPLKFKMVIQNVGFALLLLLMVFIVYNDFFG